MSEPKIDIHTLREDEIDGVAQICLTVLELPAADARTYLTDTMKMETGTVIVASENGMPLGFIRGTYTKWNMVGNIGLIATAAAAQGKGVGKALMAAFEDWSRERKVRKIFVDTSDENKNAQVFYIKCGYSPELYMVDYYADGVAGINFGKHL